MSCLSLVARRLARSFRLPFLLVALLGLVTTSPLVNALPECGGVSLSPSSIWPPNHALIPVTITVSGGSDVQPYCVMQDEAINTTGDGNTQIDAQISGNAVAVRSERSGNSDGRAYHVYFTATRAGAQCAGHALVTVPKSSDKAAVDGGPLYSAHDGADCRNLTTNNPPTVLSGTFTTNEDVAVTTTLVANDPDGNTLTYRPVTSPQHGTLSGTFPNITYTPTLNFSGVDTFTWQVNDGTVDSAIASTTITVVPVNDAPAITSTPPTAATETVALSYAPQATDAEGDAVTWSLVSGPAGATVVDGTFYWTPGYDAAGSQAVVLRATDSGGAHTDQSFTLLVADANRAPVFTLVPPTLAKALVPWTGPIAVVDSDGDSVDLVLVDAPAGMSLALMTGALVWSPTVADVGTHDISVMAVDARGAVTWHRFILAVEPPDNRAPLITSLPAGSQADEAVPYVYQLEATDPDGDTLSFELVDAPAGAQISVLTGLISWMPTAAQAGLNSFRVRVSDGRGAWVEQAFAVQVRANPPPQAQDLAVVTDEDFPVAFTLPASDPDSEALAFQIVTLPQHGTLGGTLPNLVYTPAAEFSGTDTFTWRANDGLHDSATVTVTITVNPVNDPPVIVSTPSSSAAEGTAYVYALQATDAEGEAIAWSLESGAPGAVIVDDTLRWTPDFLAAGTHVVVLRATDVSGAFAEQTFTLTVANVNRAPVFTTLPPTVAKALVAWAGDVAAIDPDGEAVDLFLVDHPDGMTLSLLTRQLAWSPRVADVGTHDVSIMAVDAQGATTWHRFVLTVDAADNNAPVITSLPLSDRSTEGVLFTYLVEANDADVGDVLSYELVDAPAGAQVSLLTGLVTWTPTAEQAGLNSFRVRVSDTRGGYTEQVFTINVRGNLAPLWVSVPPTSWAAAEGYRYPLLASDPEGQALSFSLLTGPTGMALASDALTWDPGYTHNGAHPVRVEVRDAHGLVAVQEYTLQVLVHAAPEFTTAPPTFATQGETLSYLPQATDPNGSPVTIAAQHAPAGTTLSAGVLDWTPTADYALPFSQRLQQCRAPTQGLADFDIQPVVRYTVSTDVVINTPVVGQLTDDNGDGLVDGRDDTDVVLVNTYLLSNNLSSAGQLTVMDAATGRVHRVIRDAQNRMQTYGQIALADVDGDGRNDLVVPLMTNGVAAFRADGTRIWDTDNADTGNFNNGSQSDMMIHVQDLDGDGNVEIIAGQLVLNRDGSVRLKLPVSTTARVEDGTESMAADIDGDGQYEIIVGTSVYRNNGTLVWRNTAFGTNSYVAPADFDGDGRLELFAVNHNYRAMFDDNGTVLWSQPQLHGAAGIPSVADLDGDGDLDIVYAMQLSNGGFKLIALDRNGSTLWSSAYNDDQVSGHSGIVLFDINGDGLPEVLHGDAGDLRIIDGATGIVRWATRSENRTRMESIAVADVDHDGSSEILAVGQYLTLIGSRGQIWMPAPDTWPQYTTLDWTPWLGTRAMPKSGVRVAGYGDAMTTLPDIGIRAASLRDEGMTLRVVLASRGEVNAVGDYRVEVQADGGAVLVGHTRTLDLAPGTDIAIDLPLPGVPATDLVVRVTPQGNTPDCIDTDDSTRLPLFRLEARDVDGDTALQMYVVNVAQTNVPPVMDDVAHGDAQGGRRFLAQVSAHDVNRGDAVHYELVSGPAGALVNAASGQVVWSVPYEAAGTTASFVVAAVDSQGARTERTFEVVVLNTPVPPVFVTTAAQEVSASVDFSFRMQAVDPNPGDQVFYRLARAPRGMVINSTTGDITWPKADFTGYVQPQEFNDPQCTGVDLVPYDVVIEKSYDSTYLRDRWKISRTGINRGPVTAGWVSYSGTWISTNSSLANAYSVAPQVSFGDSYFIDDADLDVLMSDYTYTLSRKDGGAECNTANNSIKVPFVLVEAVDSTGLVARMPFMLNLEQNYYSPPRIFSQPSLMTAVGALWQYNLTIQDTDIGDNAYVYVTSPSLAIAVSGKTLSATPMVVGDYPVSITVRDIFGASSVQEFVLRVVDPVASGNHAPVIASSPATTAATGNAWTYTLTASDPDGDAMTLTWPELPAGVVASGPTLAWTPAMPGSYAFRALVTDARGYVVQQSFTVAVTDTNTAPAISSTPSTARLTAGDNYVYALVASDTGGGTLQYSIASGPAGATIDAAGTFRWSTVAGDVGSHVIELRVTDNRGAWAYQRFTLAVDPVANRAPEILTTPPGGTAGSAYVYTPGAADPDADTLTWRVVSAPAGFVWQSATKRFYWPAANVLVGQYNIDVAVSDGSAEVHQRWRLDVTGDTNRPPFVQRYTSFGTLRPEVQASQRMAFNDPDGDAVTASLVSGPAGMTLVGDTLYWLPTSAQVGTFNFVLRVADSRGAAVLWSETITVAVGTTNVHPVITSTPPDEIVAGQTLTYTIAAYDPNGTALTYSMVNGPAGATFNATTHTLTWPTTLADVGAHTLTLRVSDGALYADQVIEVPVNPPAPLTLQLQVLDNSLYQGDLAEIVVGSSGGYGEVVRELYVNDVPVALDNGYYAFVPPAVGQYRLRATVRDATGFTLLQESSFVVRVLEDVTPPAIGILSPADGGAITAPTDIVGTVTDAYLLGYTVEIHRVGAAGPWQLIATGNALVVDGVLGRIDPSLLMNGQYEVRLRALDLGDNFVEIVSAFVVEGDLKVGNFAFTVEDASVPFSGMPVRVTRSYDTRRRSEAGDFGYGWTLAVSDAQVQESRRPGEGWQGSNNGNPIITVWCVNPQGAHRVSVTLPDGTVEKFRLTMKPACKAVLPPAEMEPQYTAEPGTTSTLDAVAADGSAFTHLNLAGSYLVDGLTGEVFDPRYYRLTTRAGYVYELEQGKGIRSISDPNGNRVTYGPNGITHSDGSGIAFTRDSQNRIRALTLPGGQVLEYRYDANGDLVQAEDALDNATTYSYAAAPFAHAMTEIRDPLNRPLVNNIYDAAGRLVAQEDNDGNRTNFEHNLDGRYSIVTDRNGNRTILEYNDRGDVTRKTDALNHVSTFTYDSFGNLLTETDPLGRTTTRVVNANGDVLSVTDALGNTTHYTYNAKGQELTITDALGRVHSSEYDVVGNLLKVRNPLGNEVSTTIGSKGLPELSRDLLGNTSQYAYDSQGHKTWELDPMGHVTTWTYDASGNVLTETRQRTVNGALATEITSYVYDAKNRVTQVTGPGGAVTRREYDLVGNEVAIIDAQGNRTETDYDAYGRVVAVRYPDGASESKSYDAEGNVLAETDRGGNTTYFAYDALKRLVRTTYADGTYVETGYDGAGQVTTETDERGGVSHHAYDLGGRRIGSTDALGNDSTLVYDANSNLVSQTDARGNTTQFVYDALGRRIQTIYADGTSQHEAFDVAGRRVSATDEAGLTTQFRYDVIGRLIEVEDAAGFITRYGYDEHGNRLTLTDANGHVTRSEYDSLGRQVAEILPLGERQTWAFDASGQLQAAMDFKGQRTDYVYDSIGRVTEVRYADGQVESFAYDANGNKTRATGAEGTTGFAYDSRDRLTEEIRPDGSRVTYGYDAAGNRARLTLIANGTSRTTRYTYDVLGRLATVTDEEGGVTRNVYDAVGNLAEVHFPNGVVTSYTVDRRNRVRSIETRDSAGQLLARQAYTLHITGRRLAIEELDGTTQQFSYDVLYRLTHETTTSPGYVILHDAEYGYDRASNRVREVVNGATTLYAYDANDRLASKGADTFSYDANGDLLQELASSGSKTYTWDAARRLQQANTPSGLVQYAYDTEGLRTAKAVNGNATRYLLDRSAAYAQVIGELDQANAANDRFYTTAGTTRLAVHAANDAHYFHPDALGSTRTLTGTSGAMTDSYRFKAFGETQSHTGASEQPFLFAGEQRDGEAEQYYLRARYYDPATGRFTARDTFAGFSMYPSSLNRFGYTGNNPASDLDPSGRMSLFMAGGLTVGAVSLAAITSLPSYRGYFNVFSNGDNFESRIGSSAFDNPVAEQYVIGSASRELRKYVASQAGVATMTSASRAGTDGHHTVPVYVCGTDLEQEKYPLSSTEHSEIHRELVRYTINVDEMMAKGYSALALSIGGRPLFSYRGDSLGFTRTLAQTPPGRAFIVEALNAFYLSHMWFIAHPGMSTVFYSESAEYMGSKSVKPAAACSRTH